MQQEYILLHKRSIQAPVHCFFAKDANEALTKAEKLATRGEWYLCKADSGDLVTEFTKD